MRMSKEERILSIITKLRNRHSRSYSHADPDRNSKYKAAYTKDASQEYTDGQNIYIKLSHSTEKLRKTPRGLRGHSKGTSCSPKALKSLINQSTREEIDQKNKFMPMKTQITNASRRSNSNSNIKILKPKKRNHTQIVGQQFPNNRLFKDIGQTFGDRKPTVINLLNLIKSSQRKIKKRQPEICKISQLGSNKTYESDHKNSFSIENCYTQTKVNIKHRRSLSRRNIDYAQKRSVCTETEHFGQALVPKKPILHNNNSFQDLTQFKESKREKNQPVFKRKLAIKSFKMPLDVQKLMCKKITKLNITKGYNGKDLQRILHRKIMS
ncbi:unnamed protein product [Moneuplotes crassus]|uniref:Uncharacterized protein n=1 Tax=Euplotes crassus TaxID=5936 RepID=A0AAD1XB86_EUPCR|nr:unnamed protein product [Moneuplotes crassus]